MRSIFRRSFVSAVALVVLACTASIVQAQAAILFDLPPQPLADSLRAVGSQTNMNVLFDPPLVEGRQAPALKAQLTADQALTRLLAGTGIQHEFLNDRTVVLATADPGKASDAGRGIQGISTKPIAEASAVGMLRLSQSDPTENQNSSKTGNSENKDPKSPSQGSPTGELQKLMIQEVLVTARRREEKAQTVPIAITALSQQTLQDNNVYTIGDLQHLVPSMTATSTLFNRDSVNVAIRGQGTNRFGGSAGVVAYLNEVPIPTGFNAQLAGGPGLLFDLENVAVLKGPQGTLFGRSAVGGALLLQSARPTNEFGGKVQLGAGNFDNREIDAVVNIPLVNDVLLTRFAFNGQQRDGFTRLLGSPSHPNGVDVDNRDFWSVRGTVSFRPSDRFHNDLIATYQEFDSNGSPHLITAVNPDPASGCVDINGDPTFCFFTFFVPPYFDLANEQIALGTRTILPSGVDPRSDGSMLAFSNITNFELGDAVTLRNIVGYTKSKTVTQFDFDTSVIPLYDGVVLPSYATTLQFTEEVQLLGKSFGERFDWQIGAFYLENILPDDFTLTRQTQFFATTDTESKSGGKSRALFAQGTYDLSALADGLSATLGVRQSWDENFSVNRGRTPGDNTPPVCTEPRVNCSFVERTPTQKSEAVTWTIGLEYQVDPATLVYLGSRRGYRPGGINGIDPTTGAQLPDIDPEYVADFELGLKSDWSIGDVAVRTNAALFYQDYSNIQATQFFSLNGSLVSITGNASKAELWGGELEAQAQLTPDLALRVTFDHLDFKYSKFGDTVLNTADLLVSEKQGRPANKYSVGLQYRVPLVSTVGEVSVRGDWSWQAESGNRQLQIGGYVPSYGLLNLSANWDEIGGGPLDASVFVSNALDEKYTLGGTGFLYAYGVDFYRFGEPRMYGVRLRYQFGAQ